MQISNNHNTPLGLPDGTVLVPGSPASVANWPQLKKNAVVQAWLESGVLSEEKSAEPFLLGTFNLPDTIELIEGGETVTKDEVVQDAFKASGLSLVDWNSLPEQDREGRISAGLESMKAAAAAALRAEGDQKAAAEQERADVIAQLEAAGAKFDKRWGIEKLQAALADAKKSKGEG